MSDEDKLNYRRRGVLKSAGALGAVGVLGSRVAQGQPTDKQLPNTYSQHGTDGDSFRDPAYFRHIADLSAARRLVRQYERSGKRSALLTPHLREQLEKSNQERVDITVTTTGRRARYTSNGSFGRTLHGWQPAPGEVEQLRSYGTVRYVPEVASTKVGLSSVQVDDVAEIADLGFVLEIGHDPEVRLRETNSQLSTTATPPSADDLRSSSHSDFDGVSHSLDSGLKIGCFNLGYAYGDGGHATEWSKNWAESQGIDTGLAKDFTGAGSWKSSDATHGTNVMDATAFMLDGKTTSSSHHVPLRVYDTSEDIKASEWRNAIEYAVKNDIPASVTALETAANEPYCTSTLCEELDSYTSAGYAMTVATGNDDESSEVCHPATSYHAIGVGGYFGSCSGGYSYDQNSNYGSIDYYADNYDTAYCKWCHTDWGDYGFQPNVYSAYEYDTDASVTIAGTSYASPIVGAGTAIHASANGPISYYDHVRKYHEMSNYTVCPSESSQQGDVLNVPNLV